MFAADLSEREPIAGCGRLRLAGLEDLWASCALFIMFIIPLTWLLAGNLWPSFSRGIGGKAGLVFAGPATLSRGGGPIMGG